MADQARRPVWSDFHLRRLVCGDPGELHFQAEGG